MFDIDYINLIVLIAGTLGIGAILKAIIEWLLGSSVRREKLSGDERENLREDVIYLRQEIGNLRDEISGLRDYLDSVESNVNMYRQEIAERNQIFWAMVDMLDSTSDEDLRQAIEEIVSKLKRFVIREVDKGK